MIQKNDSAIEDRKMKIGITGGIGSGKSYVCNILKQRGIPVYNCDDEAKRLMTESPVIRQKLCELLGTHTYINNVLNKPVIASFLFASKENGKKINDIVHPVVKNDFTNWAQQHSSYPIVVQECAILFESGFDSTVDKTIEVYAPKDIRMMRSIMRDNARQEQIESRMAQQMPEEEKKLRADFCIINDGVQDVTEQIDAILREVNDNENFNDND